MRDFSSPRLTGLLLLLAGTAALQAGGTGPYQAHAAEPAGDRWMYPNNSTPGTRATASTFSFLPSTGADDRFGQFVIKFNTVAAGIPAGLGAENYDVHQLVLTAVYASADPVKYDPTEDPRASLGPSATVADPDMGRPLELHGTGFRGGFTAATFQETSAFGSRNAYAQGFDPAGVARDVTNNVTGGFDGVPWAIGQISAPVDIDAEPVVYQPLAPGEVIPVYAHVSFSLNLALPGVANYVRQGLHRGYLWFTISSFHPVTGPDSSGFPSFFTRDHPEQALYGDVAATLDAGYSLPLRIVSYQRDPGGPLSHVSWNGSPGYKYTVETTGDVSAGPWTAVGNFTTATPQTLVWNGGTAAAQAFFRIARTPQP